MTDENYADEWETSSGFALDGATGVITDMQFGFNNNIGPGIVCANLTITLDEDGEETTQSFTVGGRNEANRDGTILEGNAKINKRSNFGILIESVKDCVDDPVNEIGRVRDVASWIGTRWTWGTIDVETTNPSTGETTPKSKFIVTEYHGRVDADEDDDDDDEAPKAKKAATKKKAATRKKAKAKDDITSTDLWAELLELAEQHDDHEDFVDEALDIDGVEGNREFSQAVMKSGPGSVWYAAHGEDD